jgi:hypothetical protein
MKYITTTDLYLTFLTRNDSYMKMVPKGSVLDFKNGDLWFDGCKSIDNEVGFLYHGYIEEYNEH